MSPLQLLEAGRSLAERIPYSAVALGSRFALASMFWRSAQTKVNGFSIREETFYLFQEEHKVPLLPPDLAAYLATIGEHAFSVLLLIGLASRLSALGLFGMTMVGDPAIRVSRRLAGTHSLDLAAASDHLARSGYNLARSPDLDARAAYAGCDPLISSRSGVSSVHTNMSWPGVLPAISIENAPSCKSGSPRRARR